MRLIFIHFKGSFRMKLAHITAAVLAAVSLNAYSATATPQAAKYNVEPTHTFVTWEARHLGISTSRGRFDKKEGVITIDRATNTGKAEISIETASVNTGVAPFDGHLKSKDFFNSEAHPKATFKADFKLEAGKVASVPGQLTMLGMTKPVVLKTNGFGCLEHPRFKKQVCGGDFEANIKRSEWGMTYGLPGIPDDIRIVVQIEAVAE
jgi:polyisoprenoid-binding protein YceI